MGSSLARLSRRLGRDRLVWLLALGVGAATFFGWIGYGRTLDPRDLGWIFHEDPFTHVMGWEQYRNAPLLQYPITRNELYGLEWSSTIVFTDSIPIAALVLRPFGDLLPHPFQYLGWWVLLSLVMQAYFGARLVLLRSERLRDAAIGSVFFVTTPVLLERLGLQTGVGSHWLLLWALWLYLSGRGPATRTWTLLLLLTVSVHAYLFVMVGGIWAAHLVSCRLRGRLPRRELAYAGGTLAVVVAWMHALGYFSVGGGAAGGGWRSSLDLIGLLAPSEGALFQLLPTVYDDPWDGSAYLGLGIVVLLVASGAAFAVRRRRGVELAPSPCGIPWKPLLVVVLGFAAFAITNHVTLANRPLLSFPLPGPFEGLYETFRGAIRMIWPAYYLLLVATLWLALRAWPARLVGLVLAGAATVQLVDLAGVGALKRAEIGGAEEMARRLDDPIWRVIAARYDRIVSVPSKHRQPDWPTFAWFAARHGLGSNIGYLSRSNPEAREAGTRRHLAAVMTRSYDPTTVYYFPSRDLWAAAVRTMGPLDLAVVADGFALLLPNGRLWASRPSPVLTDERSSLGTWTSFAESETAGLLFEGWSWPEAFGTWSVARDSRLVLPVPPGERVRVTFKWLVAGTPAQPRRLRVHLDQEVFEARFTRPGVARQHTFEITTTSRLLRATIEVVEPLAYRPHERPVEVGLIAVRVQRASEPVDDDLPVAARGRPILESWIPFGADGAGRGLLQQGWSWGEAWGTWSDDSEVSLALAVPPGERLEVSFRWLATAPPGQTQAARLHLDDRAFEVVFPESSRAQEDSFQITSTRPWLAARLEIARPVMASGRMLGIGLMAVRVRRLDTDASP